jgi:hypothetical protein
MAISLELHNTGDPGIGAEVRAPVEHALSDRPGDWRVSIVGSRANDRKASLFRFRSLLLTGCNVRLQVKDVEKGTSR